MVSHGLVVGDVVTFPRPPLTGWQRFLVWLWSDQWFWWPPAELPPGRFVVTCVDDGTSFEVECPS